MNTPLPMNDDELMKQARRRVGLKMGWAIHATVYVLVNLLLAVIDYRGGARGWHLWPLGWWGLGLAIHGLVTLLSLRGGGLRERLVHKELERLRQQQPPQGGR
jgi:2TM domain